MKMDNHKPHPQFVRGIQAGLGYWQVETQDESDAAIRRLDAERHNLYRLVQYGQHIPELWSDTAVLARNAFYLVERKGYWLEWIPVLEQAVSQWAQDDWRLQVQLLHRLGYLYQMGRQLPQAVTTHTKAEQLALGHQDAELVNQSRSYLCADHRHLRHYDQAEQYGQLALAGLEKQATHHKWFASTLIELGLVAWYRGDLAVAQERLQTAAALYHQWGQATNYLRALNNLIGVARSAKNHDQALAYYEQARPYFQSLSGEYDLTMFEVAYGGIMFELSRYPEAEAAFRRANSPYLQRSHYIHQRALVAQCLGNALLKQGRLDESENCLLTSARLWAEASDDLMLANTSGTLGELYVAKGEVDTAVTYFDQALCHLAKYPDDAMARRLQAEFTALRDELRRT